MSIYVEIRMQGDMDALWRLTQTPDIHARWDLRFTEIEYLPRSDESLPQRFLYRTHIGFGLAIAGEGETVGSRDDTRGCRTSALKFWSNDPRSLIREGSGYWQYVPTADGIRFLTRYDYRTRFGAFGAWADRLVFRPLMGWATAWSFDRLRLWLERGIDPTLSLVRVYLHALARLTLAFLWVYQGLTPKLLFPATGERVILEHSHLFSGFEGAVLRCVGMGEILFGMALALFWRSRRLFALNIVMLVVLTLGALFSQPSLFIAPFNPITLNVAMVGLAMVGLIAGCDLPSARNCRRQPEKNP